jgi:hypothetical protein
MPAPNTFVSVEGFVTHVDTELEGVTGAVGAIHLSVDNLAFLRKENFSPVSLLPLAHLVRFTVTVADSTLTSCAVATFSAGPSRFRFDFGLWWTAAAGGSVPNAQPSRAVSSVSER